MNAIIALRRSKKYTAQKVEEVQETLDKEITRSKEKDEKLSEAISTETNRAKESEQQIQSNLDIESERAQEAETKLQEAISNENDRAKEAEGILDNKITTETTRATEVETQLQNNLDTETQRAEGAEQVLTDNLNAEVERAKAAEKVLTDNLNTETNRATTREDEIDSKLDSEIARATKTESDLDTALKAETTRATAAEKDLQDNIDLEELRATEAETTLQNNLDAETDRAKKAEQQLTTNLNAEVDRAKAAEKTFTDNLVTEQSRAEQAESDLQDALDAEVTRAKAAEEELTNNLNDEIARAKVAEKTLTYNLNAEIDRATTEENRLQTALTAEETRATNRENELDEKIDAETTRATKKENELNTAIQNEEIRATEREDAIDAALKAEVSRATARENEIESAIEDEETRATKAETALQNNITAEQNRAEEAEANLQQALTTESNRAKAQEQTLQNNIDAEKSRATKAESDLQKALTAEQTRAEGAESGLDSKITAETARATKAETDLQNTIDTNKPNWDDKYTKSEIDNKFSTLNTGLDWKESVATFADLATTYPDAEDGWTVNVKDTDYTYRYDGTKWIPISANSIPKATNNIDGILSKEDHKKFDDAANAIPGINTHLSTLDSGLEAETERATAAEGSLRTDLTAETNRAKGVEEGLRTDLTAETNRAKAEEKKIADNLAAETARAEGAESTLQSAITAEQTRATKAESDLQDALDAEVARAKAAEKKNADGLASEIDRATTAEGNLQSAINTEKSRATARENEIEEALEAEVSRATGAESKLQTAVTTETNRATAAEKTLTNNLTKETTRATTAESNLQSAIDSEASTARAAEKKNSDAITAEATTARAAEKKNADAITAEQTRAQGVESDLQDAIDALESQTSSGAVNAANKLATARTFQTNLASETAEPFDGTKNNVHGVTGTLPIKHGGTGQTTAVAAAEGLLGALGEDTTMVDDAHVVLQGGSGYTTKFYRKPISSLLAWIKSKLATVATSGSYNDLLNKPTIPAATAVKGNKESNYRTGNVNLTPANIGALSTDDGGTVLKDTLFAQGTAVKRVLGGTAGTGGYVKVLTLTINNSYTNKPVTIEINQRGRNGSTVLQIYFTNANSTNPSLAAFNHSYVNSYNCYLYRPDSAVGKWELYVQKSEGYDSIDILRLHNPYATGGITITLDGVTQVTSPPEGAIKSTLGGISHQVENTLTFTGGSTATYDGSKPVTVNLVSSADVTNATNTAKSYADSLAKNYATAAQGSKADSALQKSSITTGSANGTIAVGGTDVAVKGLGSAAYAATTAFDAAGAANTALSSAKTYADGLAKNYATAAQGTKADTAVQSVKISGNATEYKSGTNVVLPAYPTTLPANGGNAATVGGKTPEQLQDYNNLTNKPTIPAAANNGTLTIQKNGSNVATFSANQSTAATANIIVPTTAGDVGAYTKTETDTKIANATSSAGVKYTVVSAPPAATSADPKTVYLVKDTTATGGDKYKEYMLIDGVVTQIGDTSADLTQYAKATDVSNLGKTVKEHEISISLVTGKANQIELEMTDLYGMKELVAKNYTDISNLKTSQTEQDSKITALETSQAAQDKKITDLESLNEDVENVATGLASLSSTVSGLGTKVSTNESNISSLLMSQCQQDTKILDNTRNIAIVLADFNCLNTQVKNIAIDLSTAQCQLTEAGHLAAGNYQVLQNLSISKNMNWIPGVYVKTNDNISQLSSGINTISGGYYAIGPIVHLWATVTFSGNIINDFFYFNLPFSYQYAGTATYGWKGQFTWRFETGTVKDKNSNIIPLGIYTTDQVAYSQTDKDYLVFSANKDQYVSNISPNTKIIVTGWYVRE